MHTKLFGALMAVAVFLCTAVAEEIRTPPPTPPMQSPPPVYQAAPDATRQMVYVYAQKPLAGMPALIAPGQAQAIVDQFRTNLAKLGGQRVLIYVNRDLVDKQSGLKIVGRSETVESTHTSTPSSATTNSPTAATSTVTHSVANNTYINNGQNLPALADRQTVRDIERLMGRPLRGGGASLIDQNIATQLMEGRPIDSITSESEQARKDREAVSKIADVAVEVLMTSRNVSVPDFSGDRNYTVPDLQMTAIRLQDAKVIGQASASDVMNKRGGASYVGRMFGVESITEATTLALMEDMLQEAK